MSSNGIVPVYWRDIDLVTYDSDGKAVWDVHVTVNGIDWNYTVHTPAHLNGDKLKLELLFWTCITEDGGIDDDYFRNYTPEQMEWARSPLCEELRAWIDEQE